MITKRGGMGACCALWLGVVGGCSFAPAYERPESTMPTSWAGEASGSENLADPERSAEGFWKRFASPELEDLLQRAVAHNHDAGAATERIAQARASLKSARSALYPSVEGGGGATTSWTRQNRGSFQRNDNANVSVSASYELDLWGKNRAARDAGEADLLAAEYDRAAVALSLEAEVATAYFQALALRDRVEIAEENLAAAKELLRLVEVRLDFGEDNALALAQQRTTVLDLEASVPPLQQSLQQTLNALAVLCGTVPQGFHIEGSSLDQISLPTASPGTPKGVLDRRPDLMRAEANLVAANADIGAARAQLYPSLQLSASGGLTSVLGGTSLVGGVLSGGSTLFAQLAASLTQTLFSGGRLRAQVKLSEARKRELAEAYLQAVLVAFREVEDSLAAIEGQKARADLLAQAADQAAEAYRLAKIRYEAGADDLLALLESQRTRLSAQDGLIDAQLSRFNAAVSLFQAVGGDPSWTRTSLEAADARDETSTDGAS